MYVYQRQSNCSHVTHLYSHYKIIFHCALPDFTKQAFSFYELFFRDYLPLSLGYILKVK